MNIHTLIAESKKNSDILTIEATVITGFEFLAQDECREKCKPLSISKAKGRIFFNIPSSDFKKVLSLRSVDNIFLVTETTKAIPFEGKKEKDLEVVKSLVEIVDWETSLKKWAEIVGFNGIIYPREKFNPESAKSVLESEPQEIKKSEDPESIMNENKFKCNQSVTEFTITGISPREILSKYGEPSENFYDDKTKLSDFSELEKMLNVKHNGPDDIINTRVSEVNTPTESLSDKVIKTDLCLVSDQDGVTSQCAVGETESDLTGSNQNNLNTSSPLEPHISDPHDKTYSKTDIELLSFKEVVEATKTDSHRESGNKPINQTTFKEDDVEELGSSVTEAFISTSNEGEFTLVGDKEDRCGNAGRGSLKEANGNEFICTKGINVETFGMVGLDEATKSFINTKEHQEESKLFCEEGRSNLEEKECANKLREEGTTTRKDRAQKTHERNKQFGRNNRGKQGWRGNRSRNTAKQSKNVNDGTLKFRATCYRVGEKHSFSSMEAACEFGGTLQDKFGWTVDLTQFDLNVILNIEQKQGYVCMALTQESLHRRNITHFNNTTLRATMCYNLFRLAEPMTGEIVIDPLCGGGSIPIEGALSFPNTFHVCGDYNDKAMERTRANIQHLNKINTGLKVDPVRWNAKRLPLRAQSVDILVTDLPFGKRSGSKQDNQRLYSNVLYELAKVVKTGTGRACLLTYDKTSLIRALRSQSDYWREIRQFGVNQGGLFSSVFLLLRKATAVSERSLNTSTSSVEKDNSTSMLDEPPSVGENVLKAEVDSSSQYNCEASITDENSVLKMDTQSNNHPSGTNVITEQKCITDPQCNKSESSKLAEGAVLKVESNSASQTYCKTLITEESSVLTGDSQSNNPDYSEENVILKEDPNKDSQSGNPLVEETLSTSATENVMESGTSSIKEKHLQC